MGQEVGCCGLDPCRSSACPHLNPRQESSDPGWQLARPPRYPARLRAALGSVAGAGGAGRAARTCLAPPRLGCGLRAGSRVSFLADLPGRCRAGVFRRPFLPPRSGTGSRVFPAGEEELGSSPKSWRWSSLSSPSSLSAPLAGGVRLISGRRVSPEGTARPATVLVGECPPARPEPCLWGRPERALRSPLPPKVVPATDGDPAWRARGRRHLGADPGSIFQKGFSLLHQKTSFLWMPRA